MKNKLLLSLVACALPLVATTRADNTIDNTSTTAPAMAADEAPWQFGVTLPVWASGINGNSTFQGKQVNTDISFDKLKDRLDASFSLGLEAHKGKLGFYGDVGYMKFSPDSALITAISSGDLKIVIADAGMSYVLVKTGEEHPFILAGTAGIRYWHTDNSFRFGTLGGSSLAHGDKKRDLVDPVIGLRGSQYLTQKLHLDFSADIGGFDISNDTDMTLSAMGVATYDFCKWFSLSAGYKALAIDESNGSGVQKNGIDLIFNGVMIAATLKF